MKKLLLCDVRNCWNLLKLYLYAYMFALSLSLSLSFCPDFSHMLPNLKYIPQHNSFSLTHQYIILDTREPSQEISKLRPSETESWSEKGEEKKKRKTRGQAGNSSVCTVIEVSLALTELTA